MFTATGRLFSVNPARKDETETSIVCASCLEVTGHARLFCSRKCISPAIIISHRDRRTLLRARGTEEPRRELLVVSAYYPTLAISDSKNWTFTIIPTVQDGSSMTIACANCLHSEYDGCRCNALHMFLSRRDQECLLAARICVDASTAGSPEGDASTALISGGPATAGSPEGGAAAPLASIIQGAIAVASDVKSALCRLTTPDDKKLPELASSLVKALRESREANAALKRDLDGARAEAESLRAELTRAQWEIKSETLNTRVWTGTTEALRAELAESRKTIEALTREQAELKGMLSEGWAIVERP